MVIDAGAEDSLDNTIESPRDDDVSNNHMAIDQPISGDVGDNNDKCWEASITPIPILNNLVIFLRKMVGFSPEVCRLPAATPSQWPDIARAWCFPGCDAPADLCNKIVNLTSALLNGQYVVLDHALPPLPTPFAFLCGQSAMLLQRPSDEGLEPPSDEVE